MLSLTVPPHHMCAVPPLIWAFALVSPPQRCASLLCALLGPQPCVVNLPVLGHNGTPPPLWEDVPEHTCLGGPPMGPP